MAKKINWNEKARKEMLSTAQQIGRECETITANGRNLTALYLQGKLDACYHRDDTLIAMQKILLRKGKANVLLTGPAGCGKTAIAEGLTALLAEKEVERLAEVLCQHAEYDKVYAIWEKPKRGLWKIGKILMNPNLLLRQSLLPRHLIAPLFLNCL